MVEQLPLSAYEWQYRMVDADLALTEARLNELGHLRWELCGAIGRTLIFKRVYIRAGALPFEHLNEERKVEF